MLRAVLDPGVLIAAILSPKGAPSEIVQCWLEGDYDLVASPKLLEELERVLQRPKFRQYLSQEEAKQYGEVFQRFAFIVEDPPEVSGLTPDPGDDYLVNLAQACGAHFLVSGDPHLTALVDPPTPILTPREFLTLLHGQPPRPPKR